MMVCTDCGRPSIGFGACQNTGHRDFMDPPHDGALAYRVLGDGTELCVYRMIPGQVRLCHGEVGSMLIDRGWCFHDVEDAFAAVESWDGLSDKPPGKWYRDLQTAERREFDDDGNVTKEYVLR